MFKMTIELDAKLGTMETISNSYEGKSIEALKDRFEQEVLTLCEENGLYGIFYATVDFEDDETCLESDENYIFVDSEYDAVETFETSLDEDYFEKAYALIEALGLEIDEMANIEVSSWNDNVLEIGKDEYLVVNESEREEAVTEEIKNTLWGFKPTFLAQETDWDLLPVFEHMAKSGMCEDVNEPIKCLIEKFTTLEDFVDSAVSADGYGSFLSYHDGNELEHGEYFIYRR